MRKYLLIAMACVATTACDGPSAPDDRDVPATSAGATREASGFLTITEAPDRRYDINPAEGGYALDHEVDLPTVADPLTASVHEPAYGPHPVAIPSLGEYGRIIMRSGCLLVHWRDEDYLAVIPRELGLIRDDEGYLAVGYRYSGLKEPLARVGTEIGPFAVRQDQPEADGPEACAAYPQLVISDVRQRDPGE